ncbi:MAG: hypothetical protein JRH01_02785 [Deltaproteobacteria bacterium]|nr:hypothetical protein [Deltaproteobacteria bacterium]
MRRFISVALIMVMAGFMFVDSADAKKRKKIKLHRWNRYDATMVCDVASTTVVVHNPSKYDLSVLVRLTDVMGDTQQVMTLPAESIKSFDCTSTGVTTTGVLSLEGPFSLHATATYVGGGGSVDVERLVPIGLTGRHLPHDDSDTGDSDSASGDPTPIP